MTPDSASMARVLPGAGRFRFYYFIFACIPVLLAGCHRGDSASSPPPPPVHKELWKEFSGENAFACVKALVDFGPRPSGSRELAATRDYLEQTLKQMGWQVESQKFNEDTPCGSIAFVNLIARFPASADKPAATDTQQAMIAS